MTWVRDRFVAIAAIACLCGYVYAYTAGRAGTPIRSDAFSYYVYLPAWALHHDPTLEAVAADCCGGQFPAWTAIVRWPLTQRWVDAHPIGEAILIAPFFALAHALTRWTNFSPDGFSPYYQHGAGLAGLCYVLVGLWFLRRLLDRHVGPGVTAATLCTLLLGTSLFHYATFDSVWSHAFSFALCSALLERLDAWQATSGWGANVAIGVLTGLLVLVRHTNAVIPICLLATPGVRNARLLVTVAIVATLIVLPQLWIYYAATHHWIVSSYGDLGFTFSSPHIAGVLVSPRKGLFFWAPVLLLATAGFARMPPSLRRWRVAAIAAIVINTYVIASWWDWQFGASYGHRGFVDVYPLFALGLAAAFARIAAAPRLRVLTTALVTLLCALSVFQMLQYWHGVLPMADITWRQYQDVFLHHW